MMGDRFFFIFLEVISGSFAFELNSADMTSVCGIFPGLIMPPGVHIEGFSFARAVDAQKVYRSIALLAPGVGVNPSTGSPC